MLPKNSDEQDFFKRVNKNILGDQYEDVMTDLRTRQQSAVVQPVIKRRWLSLFAVAATLGILIWSFILFMPTTNEANFQPDGLLASLNKANTPLTSGSGSIFDHHRGEDAHDAVELLSIAKQQYGSGAYKKAATTFQNLIEEDSQKLPYRLYLASCNSLNGDHQEAINNLEKLIDNGENAAPEIIYQAKYYLGINLAYVGNTERAKAILQPLAEKGWAAKRKKILPILAALDVN